MTDDSARYAEAVVVEIGTGNTLNVTLSPSPKWFLISSRRFRKEMWKTIHAMRGPRHRRTKQRLRWL